MDRAVADLIRGRMPELAAFALGNAEFQYEALRRMLAEDVTQVINLGCGMPTLVPTHRFVEAIDRRAHVVYVDRHPVVVDLLRTSLAGETRHAVVEADLRSARRVLADEETRAVLDLSEPVGVLVTGVLHYISDADEVLARYHDLLPAGSVLAFTHAVSDHLDPNLVNEMTTQLRQLGLELHLRPQTEVLQLLGGWRPRSPLAMTRSAWPGIGVLADTARSRAGPTS